MNRADGRAEINDNVVLSNECDVFEFDATR